jgi:hypothetical protein
MKFVLAGGCLAVGLALASQALADGPTVATLQQPLPAKTQFIANGAIWDCAQSICVADNASTLTFGVSECHDVARRAGPVAEFRNEGRTLKPDLLDRCNAGAPSKTSLTASR